MSRSQTLTAILLQTHEVGEADRFCVLFSRERGRLAARARGARRSGSKLSASTLALQEVRLQVSESSSGLHITAAEVLTSMIPKSASQLCVVSYAAELVQHLTHDDEALPAVYDLLQTLISVSETRQTMLPFTARLLHILGLLPDDDHALQSVLPANADREYVRLSTGLNWVNVQTPASQMVARLCERVLQEQTGRIWKVPDVARQLRD